MRLTLDLMGRPGMPGLFSFQFNQTRRHPVIRDARWYNPRGEYWGQGDLDANDFRKMMNDLLKDEAAAILSPHLLSEMLKMDGREAFWKTPGTAFVGAHASYVVGRHRLYVVDPIATEGTIKLERYGVTFDVTTSEEATRLLYSTLPR